MAGKDRRPQDAWSDDTTSEAKLDLVLPSRAERRPVLRQINGPGAPRDHRIQEDRVVVGRSRGAELVIDSPELSRQHIRIERNGEEYRCTDLDSCNGLYLNGIKVHSCTLRVGDTVQIGNVTFVYEEVES
ncbi:MAG: FHA domain-containing protein [Pseudomonadota bacterium]